MAIPAILLALAAGCARPPSAAALPPVAALPNPALPGWIRQISPLGRVESGAQIRIRFQNPIVPLEAIESNDRNTQLDYFSLEPALPGRFIILTPRMVGFEAERAIPKATRVRVTLHSGLSDLAHNRLDRDLSWTFTSEPLKFTNLPGNAEDGGASLSELSPAMTIEANAAVDVDSLARHVTLQPGRRDTNGKFAPTAGTPVEVDAVPAPESTTTPLPEEAYDPSLVPHSYVLRPKRVLDRGATYVFAIAPGVMPLGGNVPSTRVFSGHVQTYGPFVVSGIKYVDQPNESGAPGRFASGAPVIEFTNPLDPKTIAGRLEIAPRIDPAALFRAREDDNTVALNPWLLRPQTDYTITVKPGIKDKFGQTLDVQNQFTFHTGDLAADFWAPAGLNIFPAMQNLRLELSATNLPDARYQGAFRSLLPGDLVRLDPESSDFTLQPNQSYSVARQRNRPLTIPIALREKLGGRTGLLGYTVRARTNTYTDQAGKSQSYTPAFSGAVGLTNLGIFAQWFPQAGSVTVAHLADGSPVPGARVDVYVSQLSANARGSSQPCASGVADRRGVTHFSGSALQPCLVGDRPPDQAPNLLTVARDGSDWSFVRSNEWSGAYGYGVDAGWSNGQPDSRGTIFSDRQLYQPGERAVFTLAAYYLQNGALHQDRGVEYGLVLIGPSGEHTALGKRRTDEYGIVPVPWQASHQQALGDYSIEATGPSGVKINGSFRVAEFKPPNFKAEVKLNAEVAAAGGSVSAAGESRYLFGAPLQGGTARYTVTRSQTAFVPKGWEQFTFGRSWFWPEEAPSVDTDVLQKDVVLDSQGRATQDVAVAKDLPFPMSYRVDFEAHDISNLSVADSKTFTALPSLDLIGINSDFVGSAGQAFPFQLIVTDPQGHAQAGRRVHVELDRMHYSSATQLVDGGQTARESVQYEAVDQADVQSSATPLHATLRLGEAGSYRLRASFPDAGEASATNTQVWASGENPVAWSSENKNKLEIKLDKTKYRVGETATAVLQSPYKRGDLTFSVIRDRVLMQSTRSVSGGAPRTTFRVTAAMVPNAAVEAVLVRRGEALDSQHPQKIDSLARIGFAPFHTSLDGRRLKVAIDPLGRVVSPGANQRLRLQLRDEHGPARGELVVVVANDAILQLSGYRLPDLLETVYADQPISMRFADNRGNVVLSPLLAARPKGWGYGGGFLAAAANTRFRKNFAGLAYYQVVRTSANGAAEVSFRLPDDLTTWRVMVAALAGNAAESLRLGGGEATFVSSKALLTNPLLPQFARPGDRFEGGISALTTSGTPTDLTVSGALSGALAFDRNGTSAATTEEQVRNSGMSAYRFPIAVGTPAASGVRFVTKSARESDAFSVPFEIREREQREGVVESGVTAANATILLASSAQDSGTLGVWLAGSIVPAVDVGGAQALRRDALPFAEPAASRLRIESALAGLRARYGNSAAPVDYRALASKDGETLRSLQRSDGGFYAWPGARGSDPYVTPYVVESLASAAAAGLTVDSGMVSRARGYLAALLADPQRYGACGRDRECKNEVRLNALRALAATGPARTDYLSDIYAGRDALDWGARLRLARLLWQVPGWHAEAQTLTAQLEQQINESGRNAAVTLPGTARWFDSPLSVQAQALQLFVRARSRPELLDKLVRTLLAQACHCGWATSYETAEALTALAAYDALQTKAPDFAVNVTLGGREVANERIRGFRNSARRIKVPAPSGKEALVLTKRGTGDLHYIVDYSYAKKDPQPGQIAGLRVVRELHALKSSEVLLRNGLQIAQTPLQVSAGQVFDVALELIADHPVDNVVLTDPLPAGLEAVDTTFQTSARYFVSQSDNWSIDYQTIYKDRVVAFSRHLEPGVYWMHHLVRSVTPGTYRWPGARAELQYAPEEFGRTASGALEVTE